jgi:hypothetical protein
MDIDERVRWWIWFLRCPSIGAATMDDEIRKAAMAMRVAGCILGMPLACYLNLMAIQETT